MNKWLLALMVLALTFPAFGSSSYVGIWAKSQKHCLADGDQVPMEILEKEIKFYESACSFKSILHRANTWIVKAECSGEGEIWTDNLHMTVSGDKLIFAIGNEKDQQYVRCQELKIDQQIAILEEMVRDGEITRDCASQDHGGEEIVTITPIDLDQDGQPEYEVSGTSGCTCGARRCNQWVYKKTPDGYKQILGLVQPDEGITVLNTTTNGYADLEVIGLAGNEALREVFRFDGRKYQGSGLMPFFSFEVDRNISDEFYSDKMSAITKYSTRRTVPFQFSKISFIEGKFYVTHSEVPSTLEEEQNQRIEDMNKGKDYWANWFDATQNTPLGNTWELTCVFPATEAEKLSKITKGDTAIVDLKIDSATDKRLVFDCRIE